jgi:hypothetical protein
MRLGLGLGVNSITSQKTGAGFTGILDEYSGAVAAYSVRRLSSSYTDGLIRVRRSSDDTEQDIGFDANGDLDSTALLAFVNEDYNTHTSDFSGGTDGWFANGGTADGNIDGISDGTTSKDDVLRLTLSGGATNHSVRLNGAIDLGNVHDVSFEYYIPSGQTLDGIKFQTSSGLDGNYQQSVVGTWTSVTISDWSITGGEQFRVYAMDGGSITVDADGDVFYLKNIVVTQTTAEGFVSKWYDQSGNGNDAINADASEQPLVVSGGTLVEENSKAAIDFDGVDDKLGFASNLNIGGSPSIIGVLNTAAGDIVWRAGGSDYWYFQAAQLLRYRNGDFDASWTNSDGLPVMTGSQKLVATYKNSTSVELAVDGTSIATKSSGTGTDGAFNNIGSNLLNIDGVWQELIIFNSDQSSNRTGMETNINDHFDIYTP